MLLCIGVPHEHLRAARQPGGLQPATARRQRQQVHRRHGGPLLDHDDDDGDDDDDDGGDDDDDGGATDRQLMEEDADGWIDGWSGEVGCCIDR